MKIGVAKRNVSTQEPEVRLAGFGNPKRIFEGMHDDIWVRAIVFEDESGERAAVVTGDTLGFDRTRFAEIAPAIAEKTGLSIDHILFNASHTHSAPNTMRQLSPAIGRYHKGYADWFYEQVVGVLADAAADLEPAYCDLAFGSCAAVGINRRRYLSGAYEFAPNESGIRRDQVPVFRVTAADGHVKAIWTKLTCHPSTVGFNFGSGDWPGYARQFIEAANPGAIALFTQGCCGNIRVRTIDDNPDPDTAGFRGGQWADIEHFGKILADCVQDVLQNGVFESVSGKISAAKIEFPLPLQPKASKETYANAMNGTYSDATYQYYLDHYDDLPEALPYTLQRIDIGHHLTLIGMEGEVVVEYEYLMDLLYPSRHVVTLGYSNGNPGYICTREMYDWGGYEPDRSAVCYYLQEGWKPESEDVIMESARRLASR